MSSLADIKENVSNQIAEYYHPSTVPLKYFHGKVISAFSTSLSSESNKVLGVAKRIIMIVAAPFVYLLLGGIALIGYPLVRKTQNSENKSGSGKGSTSVPVGIEEVQEEIETDTNEETEIERIIQQCMDPDSDERMTLTKVYSVFRNTYQGEFNVDPELFDSENKTERKGAKRRAKEEIRSILDDRFEKSEHLEELREIVAFPRLAEARYALSKGIKAQTFLSASHRVMKLCDRKEVPILVFKQCSSEKAQKEVSAYNISSKWNINIKETVSATLQMNRSDLSGVAQKYIKGGVSGASVFCDDKLSIEEFSNLLDDEDFLEQFQYLFLFDLLNLNDDRHSNNYQIRIRNENTLFAIDHDRLGSGFPFSDLKNGLQNNILFSEKKFLPSLKEFIKNLNVEDFVIPEIQEKFKIRTQVISIDIKSILLCLQSAVNELDFSPKEFSGFLHCLSRAHFGEISSLSELLDTYSVREIAQLLITNEYGETSVSEIRKTAALNVINYLSPIYKHLFSDFEEKIQEIYPVNFFFNLWLDPTYFGRGHSWNSLWYELFISLLLQNKNSFENEDLNICINKRELSYLRRSLKIYIESIGVNFEKELTEKELEEINKEEKERTDQCSGLLRSIVKAAGIEVEEDFLEFD